jgi:CheY-like chemotaxis protein
MLPFDDSFFRILCVDDNLARLQTLSVGLRPSGFEVISSLHGMDALIQFQTYGGKFGTILLTDHDRPYMNGEDFATAIRAWGYRGRILVRSEHLPIEYRRSYQNLEVTGFLHQAFDVDMVTAMLLQEKD